MKFCPICKKDYNDDEPLCPSCGGTLLNGSYSDSVVLFESEHEEIILKLFNFLRENNFSSAQYYSDSTSGSFYLTCSAAEEEDWCPRTFRLCLGQSGAYPVGCRTDTFRRIRILHGTGFSSG